jgi:hypothetical protein
MGVKIFYDNVGDLLELNRYPTDLAVTEGTVDDIYPASNVQHKSRHVFTEIYPDATSGKATLGVYFYHLDSGNFFRGGYLAGVNFQNTGALKYQVYADFTAVENRAAYQDIVPLNGTYFTGSPGLAAATYRINVYENVTQLVTVSNAGQYTPGRYVRIGSPGSWAKILAVESATQLRITVPSDLVAMSGIASPATTLYETYTPQYTTAAYDSGITDSIGSPFATLGSPTVVTVTGSPQISYAEIVTQLNAGLTGVTATLASDGSYIRFQSSLTGSPSSCVQLASGSPNDLLSALDGGNGCHIGKLVDSYTRATDIITPYSAERASATWGTTYWNTGQVSETLLDYSNDVLYDLGSPHITTAFGVYATFYADVMVQESVRVGRFTQGRGFVPKYSFSKNYDFKINDSTKQIRTAGGSLKSIGQPWFRECTLSFNALRDEDKNILMDMMRTVGLRQDVAISLFPDDPNIERLHMGTFIGRFKKSPSLREVQYGWYSTTLELQETN